MEGSTYIGSFVTNGSVTREYEPGTVGQDVFQGLGT
jgi:hypothetical protein